MPTPRKRMTTKKLASVKNSQIEKQLVSIYEDDHGNLPDMKKIKIKKGRSFLKTLVIFIIFCAVLAAIAWIGFFLMPGNGKFSADKVNLSVNGPDNIMAGVTTTYQIDYKNNQNLSLESAVLNVEYPAGFIFISSNPDAQNTGHTQWDLGKLSPFQVGTITITGITYGSTDQSQSWRAFLTYQPENFNSEFQKTAILEVKTTNSPFSLTIAGPDKAAIGNLVEYDFTVKQENPSRVSKLDLIPSVPANFHIASATPVLNKNKKWSIDLAAGPSTTANTGYTFKLFGKFSSSSSANTISGILSSSANDKVFQLAKTDFNTELLQSDLGFSLTMNGTMANFNAQPGDMLNITIDLKNTSNSNLKNAIVKLNLDAPSLNRQSVLDWSQEVDKYNADIKGVQISDTIRRGEMTFSKTQIAGLGAVNKGDEITIDTKIPIKTSENFDLSNLSAFQINAAAEVSYTDSTGASHTISSNLIVITLNSDLKFDPRDSASGDNKTHQINWVLTNHFHALKNVTLTADVYGDVSLQGQPSAPAGTFNFDSAAKKITWTIPEMPENADTLAMPFTLILSKLNPTQNTLVSKVHVQADDTVTGQRLDFMGDEILLNQ
ncbi:MAG: hypothetical protein WC526_01240 [Patescibacteria group bacterium]